MWHECFLTLPDHRPSIRTAGILSPLLGFLAFPVLVTAGLWYRHRPDIHKRLMLFAVLGLHGVPLVHPSGYLLGRWPAQRGLIGIFQSSCRDPSSFRQRGL
jgi:hypothetical protein